MSSAATRLPLARRQHGATMIIALIMLLVLTVLGTATARMTILEERMTGNTQDYNVAFQVAEASLRAGEEVLRQAALPEFGLDVGMYFPADPDDLPLWETVDWGNAGDVVGYAELADAPGALASAAGNFIIEELPRIPAPGESLTADAPVDDASFYRITARGTGVAGNAQVTLQTTFKR